MPVLVLGGGGLLVAATLVLAMGATAAGLSYALDREAFRVRQQTERHSLMQSRDLAAGAANISFLVAGGATLVGAVVLAAGLVIE